MKYDFTAIDFETATSEPDSACSVGIACVKDLVIVETAYFLIQPPENAYDPRNSHIHKITPDMTCNEDSFDIVWGKISGFITNAEYVFAHNARFDMSVLRKLQERYALEIETFKYIDSMSFSSKKRTTPKRSLEACCEDFNIELQNHHYALCDAKACAQIVIESVKRSRYKTFQTYLRSYSSIPIHDFCEVKPSGTRAVPAFRHAKKISYSEIKKEEGTETIDEIRGKTFVVTGELYCLPRKDLCQLIVNAGGLVKGSVSKKTDYLIVGQQDQALVGEKGISTKEVKANEIIEAGGSIAILHEEEFKALFHLA